MGSRKGHQRENNELLRRCTRFAFLSGHAIKMRSESMSRPGKGVALLRDASNWMTNLIREANSTFLFTCMSIITVISPAKF